MQVTFELPEDIAGSLGSPERPLNRAAVEALGAEGYRSGLLTETQLMRMLELDSRFAVHGWLRERRIPYRYTEVDLETDLAHLSALGLR